MISQDQAEIQNNHNASFIEQDVGNEQQSKKNSTLELQVRYRGKGENETTRRLPLANDTNSAHVYPIRNTGRR